jgi:hypothetical protein
MNKEKPYLETKRIVIDRKYNPNYGDDRICECGHPYYRHFDTYDNMNPCGCKYCECMEFKLAVKDKDKKYLVRPDDFMIFAIDPKNGCYRGYEPKYVKNYPHAYEHFTFKSLTEDYSYFPISEEEIPIYEEKHNFWISFSIWQSRNDGHGGRKGGTEEEYIEYLERVKRYNVLKDNDTN